MTDQILATLDDEGCLPIPTMALLAKRNAGQPDPTLADVTHVARTGTPAHPARVEHAELLRLLSRLSRLGEVEKIPVPGMRCRYWRRTIG